jgi:hypothetical protein
LSDRLIRTSRYKGVASRQGGPHSSACHDGTRCAVIAPAAPVKPPRLRLALTRSPFDPFSFPPPCPRARSSPTTIMAPNLAVAQREQIHAMLQAGRFTADQIAKVAGCSSQSVSAIRSNIRAFGSPRALFTASPGRPRSITPTMFFYSESPTVSSMNLRRFSGKSLMWRSLPLR